jgi:hypothetical protein
MNISAPQGGAGANAGASIGGGAQAASGAGAGGDKGANSGANSSTGAGGAGGSAPGGAAANASKDGVSSVSSGGISSIPAASMLTTTYYIPNSESGSVAFSTVAASANMTALLCRDETNLEILHEAFRQAFLLPFERNDVIKMAIAIYKLWCTSPVCFTSFLFSLSFRLHPSRYLDIFIETRFSPTYPSRLAQVGQEGATVF